MPSPARAGLLLVAAGLLVPLLGSCARQEPPPGAEPESRPPEISELYPPRDTVLPELDGAARVEFDEPISPPGDLTRALRASPAYRYRVSAGHHGVEIRPEEGWRPGAVYVLELTGTISDLLNNRREEPISWRFSTGPPVTGTRVAGTLWDRVTGEQLREGRAHFLPVEGDSIPYAAVPDSGGIFRLDAVPPGRYRAVGFVDRNRNLSPDELLEPSDTARFELEGPSDGASLQLVLVEPDSTPPVLGQVEARDSMTVRLTFDDYLLPEQELGGAAVTLSRAGREGEWPLEAVRVLTPDDTLAARADTAAAPSDTTTAAGDTAAVAPDTAAALDTAATPSDTATAAPSDSAAAPTDMAAPPPGMDRPRVSDTTTSPVERLPTRSVRIRLAEPMARDTYRIRIQRVRNLRRLAGGGDTTFVYSPSDTAGADTASVADTAATPDTAALSDTTAARDTAAAPPTGSDTAAADTTSTSPAMPRRAGIRRARRRRRT